MHCTIAFLDEYPLPDSFELKILPSKTILGVKAL